MNKRIYLQIGLWLTIILINLAFMGVDNFRALFFELFCVGLYAFSFYLNVLLLFPKYYDTRKFKYWLYGIILMGLVLSLINLVSDFLWGNRKHHHNDWLEIILTFRQALWIVLIFLIGTMYSIQEMLNRQIEHNKKVIEEKLQTELQLLKAQINPHFLFNALNDIYSLTYLKSEKAPESVLKLADMLRYVLDDCSLEKVPLQGEINYMENLINFYQMKSPGKRKISFTQVVENKNILIAPMLFIPFIENSFKYSRIEEDKKGFILINLQETSGMLSFTIENSIFQSRTILSGSKKGIANVKQRLEIIYPGKHTLTMNEKDNGYFVNLEIELK
jgi:LytS/YehU family sensor histidine kinase